MNDSSRPNGAPLRRRGLSTGAVLVLPVVLALAAACSSSGGSTTTGSTDTTQATTGGAPSAAQTQAAAPSSAPSQTSVSPVTVKTTVKTVTMSVTGTHWPEIVAQAKGFYAQQGLTVDETLVKPPVTVTTLLSGDTDISFADSTSLAAAIDKGAPLVAIGQGMDRTPYSLVGDVKTVADLKGKRIGADQATSVYTGVIRDILTKAGLDPNKDVTWVYGGSSSSRLQELEGGAINATLEPPPAPAAAVAKGYHILAKTRDYVSDLTLSVTATTKAYLKAHPDVVKRYLKAIAEASQWLNDPANKTEAIAILAKATKTTVADSTQAYAAYIGSGGSSSTFHDNGCVQPDGFTALLQRMASEKQIKDTNVNNYIDTSYCPTS